MPTPVCHSPHHSYRDARAHLACFVHLLIYLTLKAFKCVTLVPDLLSFLKPSNIIFIIAFQFSKSISSNNLCHYHILIFLPPSLSKQLGILYILPSSQSSPFSSGFYLAALQPSYTTIIWDFPYYFTRLILLLPGSHIFPLVPFREGNFFVLAWEENR